jgi:hypothetical protein
MGFFLLDQNSPEPTEWRRSFGQSNFDFREDHFAQSFENDLLSEKRFEQILSSQGTVEHFSILFQCRKKRRIGEMPRRQPGNGPLKYQGKRSLLTSLVEQKATLLKSGTNAACALAHSFANRSPYSRNVSRHTIGIFSLG